MLYRDLQCYYFNEDQDEVCKTTLLSLSETWCQVEGHEGRACHVLRIYVAQQRLYKVVLRTLPSKLRTVEAMSSKRLFANH